MMTPRRRWRRLGIAAAMLAVGWVLFARLRVWNELGELRLAQQEIARGQLKAAQRRLTQLASPPGVLGGAADYWLGICEGMGGHPEAALRAFGRVPEGFAFDASGAFREAKANLTQGKLRAAERRLEQALARGGAGLEQVRDLLGEIYQIEVRFDDAKVLLRAGLAGANDPIRLLKELSNFELDRLPYNGLQGALEKAGKLAPEDDRVWLGKGRLAIESGRWEEARDWLSRCLGVCADAPVWRASIELARACGRTDEAIDAARRIGPGQLDVEERHTLQAWLREKRGDTQEEASILEQWLRFEPEATRAPERLAVLSQRAGQSDRVADLRRRKADVERALEAYRLLLWREEPLRGAAERCELARLAESAGRRSQARALYNWAVAADPDYLPAREALAHLDHFDRERTRDLNAHKITWPSGKVDRHFALPADTGYLLYEGENKPRPLPGYSKIAARH